MAQRNRFMTDTALQRQHNGTALFVEVLAKECRWVQFPCAKTSARNGAWR